MSTAVLNAVASGLYWSGRARASYSYIIGNRGLSQAGMGISKGRRCL